MLGGPHGAHHRQSGARCNSCGALNNLAEPAAGGEQRRLRARDDRHCQDLNVGSACGVGVWPLVSGLSCSWRTRPGGLGLAATAWMKTVLCTFVVGVMGCGTSAHVETDASAPDSDMVADALVPNPDATITGTVGGGPFLVGDVLLVHPLTWKSGIAGEAVILISSTPRLCDQILSGRTTAPGKFLIVGVEQV